MSEFLICKSLRSIDFGSCDDLLSEYVLIGRVLEDFLILGPFKTVLLLAGFTVEPQWRIMKSNFRSVERCPLHIVP